MSNYNYEDEKNYYPYQECGKVIEEKHGNGIFLLRSVLSYVIDDYDAYLGSVEQSHYEDLGYFEVVDFNLNEDTDTLDLTWMKNEDVFCLRENEQFRNINRIQVNIDNIGFSHLPKTSDIEHSIFLTINGNNSQKGIIQQVKSYKSFIQEHAFCLNGVQLIGFSSLNEMILSKFAEKCGVEVLTQETTKKTK